jgi:hypothetical protein
MAGSGDRVGDLEAWLTPFLAVMGRKTRRRWAPFYLRGSAWPRRAQKPAADGGKAGPAGA